MIVAVGCALVVSCDERAPASRTPCDAPEVRQVVERFGERLQRVSLQAADSVVVREMRDAYAPLVTSELLTTWTSNPRSAPGREVSSPWPARIEVRTVHAAEAGGCRVEGDLIYESSAPGAFDSALRQPVSVVARDTNGWRIVSYETTSGKNQRFEGTYVLRRSVVDGATPDARGWYLYLATLRPTH